MPPKSKPRRPYVLDVKIWLSIIIGGHLELMQSYLKANARGGEAGLENCIFTYMKSPAKKPTPKPAKKALGKKAAKPRRGSIEAILKAAERAEKAGVTITPLR